MVVPDNLVLTLLGIICLTNSLMSTFYAEEPTDVLPASSFLLIAAFSLVY